MDQVHVIRHKVLVEGRTIRSVAREMRIGRNTIKKYLELPEPVRVVRQEKSSPVKELVAPRIDEIVEQWRDRTTAKQRITGTRIHRQLVEEGYRVGITTVRDYLREKRRRQSEVFIPLIHRPADEAQVDFFEVTVEEDGHRRKAWKFVMRLMYSGKDFVWLYDRADQLSFLDAHVRAFCYLGGVPRRVVYDNLAAAVKKVARRNERELTERFRALASHYLFEPCFTRPREGHDKGGVEGRGKGIRLAHLTPVPRGETLSEISEVLLREVEMVFTNEELFEEEREQLGGLPQRPFDARRVELVSVSRRSTVRIEGATYSVPSGWASLRATAHVGVEDVKLVCGGQTEIYPKERKGAKKIRYRHYLSELAKKPQAVRQVAPELIGELGEPYDKLWEMLEERYGEKEAARVLSRILGAVVDHGEGPVSKALDAALSCGRLDLLCLAEHLEDRRERLTSVAVPEALSSYQVESANATDYDRLLLGGGGT